MIDTVKQFDKHHTLHKNHHYKSSADICSNLVISFKEKLPNAYKATKAKSEVWEKNFFKKYLKEPSTKDMDFEVSRMFKSIQTAFQIADETMGFEVKTNPFYYLICIVSNVLEIKNFRKYYYLAKKIPWSFFTIVRLSSMTKFLNYSSIYYL